MRYKGGARRARLGVTMPEPMLTCTNRTRGCSWVCTPNSQDDLKKIIAEHLRSCRQEAPRKEDMRRKQEALHALHDRQQQQAREAGGRTAGRHSSAGSSSPQSSVGSSSPPSDTLQSGTSMPGRISKRKSKKKFSRLSKKARRDEKQLALLRRNEDGR